MLTPPTPADEAARLLALERYRVLDTPAEEAFDRITRLAAAHLGVPIALVSLVDGHRQWFKSRHGLEAAETRREVAFCAHAILGNDVFVVEDAATDPRFSDNPLVMGAPYVRFYAGAPLRTGDGYNLGTLCVIDHRPGNFTAAQRAFLADLAHIAIDQLELRRAITQQRQAQIRKTEFVSTVSHELRTPLTSIKGALGLIRSGVVGGVPDKLQAMLTSAYNNSERLIRLVNDILDIEKIEAGKMDFRVEPVALASLVEQTIAENQPFADKYNVRLSNVGTVAGAWVRGDPDRLSQVLTNLISNAIKFSPRGSTVEVAVKRGPADYCIAVSDQGPGIPEELRDRIFEKFFQSDSPDTRKKGGTGLGLSIARTIARRHGGDVGFESKIGVGTTFRFTLPAQGTIARPPTERATEGVADRGPG